MKASITAKIDYKEWLHSEAARLNIKVHALEMRLHRGKHPYPDGLVRGKSKRRRARHIVIHKHGKVSTLANGSK